MSASGASNKRLSLPVLHYGTSLNDISMGKSAAHRTRSSGDFSKSPPFGSEQHLSRSSRRMSLVSYRLFITPIIIVIIIYYYNYYYYYIIIIIIIIIIITLYIVSVLLKF